LKSDRIIKNDRRFRASWGESQTAWFANRVKVGSTVNSDTRNSYIWSGNYSLWWLINTAFTYKR